MTEPVLGIAGAVLLALAIAALFLRPRRSRGGFVDAGLAIGAGLLGLAIGLVVSDRVHRPSAELAALPQPSAFPQPAAPSTRYVESRLSLQFPIDDEYPTGLTVLSSAPTGTRSATRSAIRPAPTTKRLSRKTKC